MYLYESISGFFIPQDVLMVFRILQGPKDTKVNQSQPCFQSAHCMTGTEDLNRCGRMDVKETELKTGISVVLGTMEEGTILCKKSYEEGH